MKKQLLQHMKNEKGMATIEAVPILIVFVMLVAYMLGSFGIVHTGILQSVAARTYAFESFRHRANLVYLREGLPDYYSKIGNRVHGIAEETYNIDSDPNYGRPTQRSISMVMSTGNVNEKSSSVHNELIPSQVKDGVRVRETAAVNPVWIKVQYGICIDSKCGD